MYSLNLINNNFDLIINRTFLWGTSLKKEIKTPPISIGGEGKYHKWKP